MRQLVFRSIRPDELRVAVRAVGVYGTGVLT
jgi:hypothetical protein